MHSVNSARLAALRILNIFSYFCYSTNSINRRGCRGWGWAFCFSDQGIGAVMPENGGLDQTAKMIILSEANSKFACIITVSAHNVIACDESAHSLITKFFCHAISISLTVWNKYNIFAESVHAFLIGQARSFGASWPWVAISTLAKVSAWAIDQLACTRPKVQSFSSIQASLASISIVHPLSIFESTILRAHSERWDIDGWWAGIIDGVAA